MRHFSSIDACCVTSIHCGGKIESIYEPESTEELTSLLSKLDDFIVLGAGSNTIFEDTVLTKPVIRLGEEFDFITINEDYVYAGAAVSMKKLLNYCIKRGLSGIEFMAGIPGKLGGALWMNAGTKDKGILEATIDMEIIDNKGLHVLKTQDLSYGYRNSSLPSSVVITGARLALEKSSPEKVKNLIASYMKKRRNQPKGFSCGSVFKNPVENPAGLLIEKAGMKGLRFGGARVSEVHANFIINDGTATTSDIKSLISIIKKKIREEFKIDLMEEVRIIG